MEARSRLSSGVSLTRRSSLQKGIRRSAVLMVTVCVIVLAFVFAGRRSRARHLEQFEPTARAWVAAAVAGDSLTLVDHADDDEAIRQALVLGRQQPDMLADVERTMRLVGGGQDAGTVLLIFDSAADWCAGVAGHTSFAVSLVQNEQGSWRVSYAGPGIC